MKKIIIVLIAIIVLIVPFFMKDYFYNKQSALDSKEKTIYIDSNYNIESNNESKDKHIYETSNALVIDCSNKTITINKK